MEQSQSSKPETKSSSSPQDDLLEKQKQMVQEWADQTGQTIPGTAKIILEYHKVPMTQEDYLHEEGIRQELDDVLEDEETLRELPEWFQDLPRGTSPGLY